MTGTRSDLQFQICTIVPLDDAGRQYWRITLIPRGLGYWQKPIYSPLPYDQ